MPVCRFTVRCFLQDLAALGAGEPCAAAMVAGGTLQGWEAAWSSLLRRLSSSQMLLSREQPVLRALWCLVLQPGGTAAAWQCLKATAHGSPTTAPPRPGQGGKQISKLQPLIHSQICFVVDEGHPSECHPAHRTGPLSVVLPTNTVGALGVSAACAWHKLLALEKQGGLCFGLQHQRNMQWRSPTGLPVLVVESSDTLSMVSTNTTSLSASLWCWAWLPG